MAGSRFRVRATRAADAAIRELRGRARSDYVALEAALKAQGCRAAGYRLLAETGLPSEFCCKHLTGRWRVITTFDPGIVVIVAVGEHDGPRFYRTLAKQYEIGEIGQQRDQRPGCCGDEGWPRVGVTRGRAARIAPAQR